MIIVSLKLQLSPSLTVFLCAFTYVIIGHILLVANPSHLSFLFPTWGNRKLKSLSHLILNESLHL